MKKTYIPLLSTIALMLLLSGPFAINDLLAAPEQNGHSSQKMGQPKPRPFSAHDIDQDGYLNREEYRRFVEEIEIRRQSTGRPMRRYPPPLRFEEIDSNDDGHITEDEMITALNKRLRKHRRYRHHGNRW